ncbi:helix-turn-helix transcriptional regulator [Seonamhaeicola sp.]|uniref:helix-turn-helix domain-containing protein n=1 Tax=Seonamhaeicola sp. TaxID=1912245 RepID=UPI00262F3231|nr:helix-turn-helix transcriptional regulator [Seonamhaeicola sp.]
MTFEEKLKKVIKSKYATLSELAKEFDMNYSQLSQYVNGKKISIDFLNKIIKEFPEVDLNWLLRDATERTVNEERPYYKTFRDNEEIINRIEELLADLKSQLTQEKK